MVTKKALQQIKNKSLIYQHLKKNKMFVTSSPKKRKTNQGKIIAPNLGIIRVYICDEEALRPLKLIQWNYRTRPYPGGRGASGPKVSLPPKFSVYHACGPPRLALHLR